MVNNVLIAKVDCLRDSATHTHVSMPLQTPLPSRLPHDVEWSSMCYIVGLCWLCILNIAVFLVFTELPTSYTFWLNQLTNFSRTISQLIKYLNRLLEYINQLKEPISNYLLATTKSLF